MYKIASEKHLRENSSFSGVFKAIVNDVMWFLRNVHATLEAVGYIPRPKIPPYSVLPCSVHFSCVVS